MRIFVEGAVRYPDYLPCPQVDTDITPRERRYISDIGDVKKFRTFQRAYQATRQNISFVFTPEQARDFQAWYKTEIIEGGAWFYADWPVLHKETKIAYRFVTRPVWKFLALGNFHVSATVETFFDRPGQVGTYEPRRIYKEVNVFTSKLYPYYWEDEMQCGGQTVKGMPSVSFKDTLARGGASVVSGTLISYIYSSYDMQPDAMQRGGAFITGAVTSGYIYSSYAMEDDAIACSGVSIASGTLENVTGGISYEYYADAMSRHGQVIISGVAE